MKSIYNISIRMKILQNKKNLLFRENNALSVLAFFEVSFKDILKYMILTRQIDFVKLINYESAYIFLQKLNSKKHPPLNNQVVLSFLDYFDMKINNKILKKIYKERNEMAHSNNFMKENQNFFLLFDIINNLIYKSKIANIL